MTPSGTRPALVPDPAARRVVCAARRPDACRGARTAGERALGRLCARALQCARRDRGCATIYEVPAALAARGSGPRRPNCAASAPERPVASYRAGGRPALLAAFLSAYALTRSCWHSQTMWNLRRRTSYICRDTYAQHRHWDKACRGGGGRGRCGRGIRWRRSGRPPQHLTNAQTDVTQTTVSVHAYICLCNPMAC